ncbi:MAG: hypothetical protein AAF787_05995 [Chloroflexota bacterium]
MNNNRVLLFLAVAVTALAVFAFVGGPYGSLNFADAQYYDGGLNPSSGGGDGGNPIVGTEGGGVRIGNVAAAPVYLGPGLVGGVPQPDTATRNISGSGECELLVGPADSAFASAGSFETARLWGSNLDGSYLLLGNPEGTVAFWVLATCVLN